ncbi:MAG: DUF4270 domain-containing protein [Bacteroidota bacterium]
MKFSKLDLLTLLISLFLFASCENTSTIGLEIDPGKAVEGNLIDTISITSRTMMDDDAITYGLNRHPLGILNDPIFGTTEASIAMSVGLPTQEYSFGKDAIIDSAVLVLNYSSEFYGDSTKNYSIDVHQLSSNLNDAPSYLSAQTYATNNTLIGNKTGRLFPNTKYKITDIVSDDKDTLKTVTPQIRIKLANDFIQNNILNLTAADLKSDVSFGNAFKGLHVQVNKAASTANGMMFIDFATTNSSLSLYYRKADSVTNGIDTVNAVFPISTTTNAIAATIKHNYSGTPIATQLNNPNQQYAVTYLQPMSGLRNKITFPYLAKFTENIGKIVVNKAELVIDLSAGTDTNPFNGAPRLSLYKYDIAEKRTNVEVNDTSPEAIGGYYDSIKKQYIFNLTVYIQNLISGKTVDYGTYLAPIPTNEFLTTPSLTSAARAVIAAYKKNPGTGDNVMKLNIYYTKVN